LHADFRCLKFKFEITLNLHANQRKKWERNFISFLESLPEPGTFGLWGSLDVKKRELDPWISLDEDDGNNHLLILQA
jgi:hypothetical protein